MKHFIVIVSLLISCFCMSCLVTESVIAESASLQVSFGTNPTIVSPGTNGYLELVLKSVGGSTVQNIDITASNWDKTVIIPQGNWDVYYGDLEGGDSDSVYYEFKISDTASAGLYQIVFEVEYSPGQTIKQTAFMKVEDATVLDLNSVNPSSIRIGEVTTVVFNVSNMGGNAIHNILFTWEDESELILPVGSDNKITVSSIGAGESVDVPIDVVADPSIVPGVYPLTVSLVFYDSTGTMQTVTSTAGIQIGGGTDFEIVLQQYSSGSVTFAVSNTGAYVASSVIVSIPSQMNYVASGTSSSSLGNLDAGDYTLVTFQVSSLASSATNATQERPSFDSFPTDGSGFPTDLPDDFDPSMGGGFRNRTFAGGGSGDNLIVEIAYTDLFGVRQTVEKEVVMSSSSVASSASSSDVSSQFSGRFGTTGLSGQSTGGLDTGITYIVIGVVGIIVIVAVIQLGRKKKIPYFSKMAKGKQNEDH